ncbi:GDSL esterase/lipase At5g03610-like [Salvia hispanica]|uniref:GDSL esterase/lipase At5g03610-like n=1 Tax=Salvia hispanica TaxID=49212 RepID=UPI0020091741|nr:GDSL esterase/lipase At5g03610-like [Salvia hispanica]
MASTKLFLPFFYGCFLLSFYYICIQASPLSHEISHPGLRPTKLFVFGDSYADTGNVRKSLGNSWNQPYGTTFPGKPAGRFSDGRILTDFIAKFLQVKSPLAYEWMEMGGKKLKNGLNFAYGGSGVFNTLGELLPNMSTQIGFFDKLMQNSVYTKSDLKSSVVLVCLSGNDYGAFLAQGGKTMQDLQEFIPSVVDQLGANLKRVQQLGATKVAVTSLQPLGCLPRSTVVSSFQGCNTTQNQAVAYHNLLLQQTVAKLNNDSQTSTFFIIDLYTSFTTVLNQNPDYQGKLRFETPLKPCCIGKNGYFCGGVDQEGEKMYTVCSNPKSAFFWDSSHPTEAGWHAIYTTFKSSLQQAFKFY